MTTVTPRPGRGRGLFKYPTEEEMKEAIKNSKTKYMMNKEWRCEACDYKDYKLAGKYNHLKTDKHKRNALTSTNNG